MLNVNNTLSVKPTAGRSEYGRVKVALPRGKGLMDWVRMTAGKVIAKVRMPSVDHEELMKHNTKDDCWVHLLGQVYDITAYLDFHPGGVPELMRAAGRDATGLFNQYHAWVNYESMLKSCVVGRFTGDLSKLPACEPSTIDETPAIKSPLRPSVGVSNNLGIEASYTDNAILLTSKIWTGLSNQNVTVHLCSTTSSLRVLIRHFKQPPVEVVWVDLDENIFVGSFEVEVKNNKIQLLWTNGSENAVSGVKKAKRVTKKRPGVTYYSAEICDIRHTTHDTLLFSLKLPLGLFLPIPLGQHISMKIRKGSATLYRPYTPISHTLPSCSSEPGSMEFFIKIYDDGICTPALRNLKPGDTLEISDPIGDLDVGPLLGDEFHVCMLAGGTGITPMLPIGNMRRGQESSTRLVWFNKTEDDICPDEYLPFNWDDDRIQVSHVLSQPSSSWSGLSGRISLTHLPPLDPSSRIFICGPDGFVQAAVTLLEEAGFNKDQYCVFQG